VTAYRADIEIGVRGARNLEQLRSSINQTAQAVDSLNSVVGARGSLVQSIQNYTNLLDRAARSLRNVGAGLPAETKAVREYVRALGEANTARARQNALVAQEIANQRRISPSTAPYGQQGPALPPALVKSRQIQQNWNEFFREAAALGSDVKANAAAKGVNIKTNWNTFFTEAAELGNDLKISTAAKAVNLKTNWNTFFTEAAELGTELKATAAAKSVNTKTTWNTFFTEAAQLASDLKVSAAAKSVNIKTNWNTFFADAAELGKDLKLNAAAKAVNLKQSWNTFFIEATSVANELTLQAQKTAAATRSKEGAASAAARQRLADEAERRRRITDAGFGIQGPALPSAATRTGGFNLRSRVGGALGNAAIGGAFPLLFGQGGGAALGGAIGGLAGGAFGGVGGFAGSLIGTLLGEIASKGQAVKQLAEDIGFSAEQTNQLATAFKVANTDVEKFTAVIQNVRGLGLELESQAELIKLVTRLTNVYGGSFEKTGNAITSALEAGKVTQATLNQLTSQGINIQEQLATKFGVSRDALLEMAKKGKIGIQDLVNALVEMGNKGVEATKKPLTGMERLGQAAKNLGSALGSLGGAIATALAPPLNWLAGKLASIINLATTGIQYVARLIGGGTKLENQAAAMASAQLIKENPELRSQRGGGPRGTNLIVQNGVLTPGAVGRLSPQLQARYQQLYGKATTTIQQPKINNIDVSGLGQAAPAAGPKGAAGPKPPEDRTAQLLEDLQAMQRIAEAQDKMRDALFEGNKLTAITLDYDQKVADIKRDTAKSLLNANYASEKDVYLKQQAVRLADAQAVRLDEIRQLERDITEEYYSRAGLDPRNLMQNQGAGAFDLTLDLDPNSKVVQRFDEMRKRLEELQDPINMAAKGAESIGSAFSEAFTSIVTGTQSVQQALANFFKGVGTAFVDMAAQIIAQMLTMYAFKQLLGIFGGTSTGLFTGAGPVSGASVFGGGQAGFNPVAFTKGLTFSPGAKFAEGGFVTGPTRALIGEGGQSEYVIPASKMRSAMTRYAAGARGASVIPSGSGDGPGAGGTMTAAPIDVRYTVERINSVDYVTADQFQAGMRQAASQGAERGQQLALRRLQQSPSTRRRVGI
jgi:tape measure domain-containing protein